MKMKYFLRALRILVALILIQTLRFKFFAHPDSVYIFEKIGMEPMGRILIGVFELLAGILILIPRTIWMGALLSLGLMIGAVTIHFTQLGIEVNNDGGLLFYTAVLTLILSSLILLVYRKDIPVIGEKL